MTPLDDTIAAISTPLGEGGIGIVRLSGSDAIAVAGPIFSSRKGERLSGAESHRLLYGSIKDPFTGGTIDEVLVSVMKAPHTYTKEDVVEINCHGGMVTLRNVLELILRQGARLAEPGEFTKRAFLNGRLDLSQAEAVLDVIRAKTDASRKVALEQLSGGLSGKITALRDRITSLCAHIEAYIDFPEDEIEPASQESLLKEIQDLRGELSVLSGSFEEGRFFREGLKVALVGRPNVGKSSLLNALLRRERAIVTETPGTTRDVLEEHLNIKGLPVRIMDTAGIRESHEMAEREGVVRSLKALDEADIVIALVDGSILPDDQDREVLERIRGKKSVVAINKSDLPAADPSLDAYLSDYSDHILEISAKTLSGLDGLKDRLLDLAANGASSGDIAGVIVTNVRHKVALDHSVSALRRTSEALASHKPLEIVAIEIRDALDSLGEIVGVVTTEEILSKIFSEFCIGK